jgi:hypothetical protein
MFWTAIGDVFPFAIAIGLSPFAVITVVVLLMGQDGRWKATLFASGWFVVVGAIAAVAYLFVEAAEEADGATSAAGVGVVQLLLGVGFFALAWLSWRKRPSPGEPAEAMKVLERVTRISPLGAFGFGLLQGVVVVKNIPLGLAGGARLGEADLNGGQAVVGLLIFALFASAGMIALIVLSAMGGARFHASLGSLRRWLELNMTSITVAVAVLIGALLVGRGLAILD